MRNIDLFKYLKKTFLTGSTKTIIVSIITLVFLPLIINQIGMEKYGLVAMTMIFGGAVFLADFGISKTITLMLGKTDVVKEKNEIVADALLITSSILLLLGLVVSVLILLNISILGESLNVAPSLQSYILFSGFLTLGLMMLNNLLIAILESYILMHYVNIGFGLSSVSFHLLLFLISITFNSDYLLVSTPFISYALVCVYYLVLIKNKTDLCLVKPNVFRAKKMLPLAIKFLGLSLLTSLAIPVSKYLLLILSGSPMIIGIYDLSLKIANISNSFLNSIAQPLFGVFSKFKKDDMKAFLIAKKVSVVILLMYMVGVIIYFCIGGVISNLIDPINKDLLFQSSFLLIIFISFTAISEPYYRAFIGLSYMRKAMSFKFLSIPINISLFFLLYKLNPINRVIFSYGLSILVSSSVIIIKGVKMKKN